MHFVAVSGSLRRGSYNRMLLEAAARELPRGLEVEFLHGLEGDRRDLAHRGPPAGRPGERVAEVKELLVSGATSTTFTRRAWATLLVLCGGLFLDALDISPAG